MGAPQNNKKTPAKAAKSSSSKSIIKARINTTTKPESTSKNNSSKTTPTKSSAPTKKYARDSANQRYAAGKPLKAAPKLSKLTSGQTVKLKPAPSIKQVIKRPLNKTKQKRVV